MSSHPARRRTRTTGLALVVLAALIVPPGAAQAVETLGGVPDSVLQREEPTTPEGLLGEGLDSLQFGDPTDQVDLVSPPEASNRGDAVVTYPMPVPPGRSGVEPSLDLVYNSYGGNSWTGVGWDLSLGAIEVDTRWGVPRYLATQESETYALDGEVLAPTAVRSTFLPRQAERVFTRRVEGAFERIVRHGTKPGEYWWEISDKNGSHRFYGGLPETGRDPASILATGSGAEFRWGLKQVRDISGNTMTISYDAVAGKGVGDETGSVGKALYPAKIAYTGIVSPYAQTDPLWAPNDPAYEVRLVREGPRPDVIVDARGGFLQVVHERLRRVEVYHRGALARAYVLTYVTGPFGKSVLKSVGRAGSDDVVYATHDFDYFDEVGSADGTYEGFTDDGTWTSPDDGIEAIADFGPPIDASALGGGQSLGGYGRVYIGFNPFSPGKTGSFGGGIAFAGGDSWGRVELLDINGDNLPDKVFEKGGKVYYRLNESGPGSTKKSFAGGVAPDVKGSLSKLSRDRDFSFSFGVEAYPLVSVMYHHAFSWSWGYAYFEDVNSDGMVDYVDNGVVYYNKSTTSQVKFEAGDSDTAVPIDSGGVDSSLAPNLAAEEAEMRKQAPLQDTLRRWVAPWTGTVVIEAPVTLLPPADAEESLPRDGVRAAIQQNGTELWGRDITSPLAAVTPTGVSSVPVTKGDRLYFRLQSRDDGTADRVLWDPQIRYTGQPATTDVDGLDPYTYSASGDFTLGGLPGASATATLDGTLRIGGSFTKARRTSDDLRLQLLKNGVVQKDVLIGSEATGSLPFTADVTVKRPDQGVAGDKITLRVLTPSPVDLTAFDWRPTATYPNDPNGASMVVPVDYTVYSDTDRTSPQRFWTSTVDETVDVSATVDFANGTAAEVAAQDGLVYVTVKQRRDDPAAGDPLGRPVFHQVLEIEDGAVDATTGDTTLDLEKGVDYWVDISVAEPGLGKAWTQGTVTFTYDDNGTDKDITPDQGRHWAQITGNVFPMPYRGWGFAGYGTGGTGGTGLAAKAVEEPRLVLNPANFPTSPPTGPNTPGYQNPVLADAYVYTPTLVVDQQTGGTTEQWVGPKASIWGAAGGQTSSRVGPDSVTPPGTTPVSGARATTRLSWSNSDAVAASAVVIGGSGAWAFSEGLQDYTDMNGDGFPDNLGASGIQYSRPRGGLDTSTTDVFGSKVLSLEHGSASTFDLGGSVAQVKFNPKGDSGNAQGAKTSSGKGTGSGKGSGKSGGKGSFKLSKTADASYGVSLGLGGSIGKSSSGADNDAPAATVLEKQLADINGDGLPDLVRTYKQGRMTVQINLGYSFGSELEWPGAGLERGSSSSSSFGPVGGFTTPFVEFSGGVSRTQAVQSTDRTWADLNGDGIADQLSSPGRGIAPAVRFGTGGGLTAPVPWSGFRSGEIATSTANGLGGGLDFTLSFGPLCAPAPTCYLIVNPGGGVEGGMARQELELVDVNGDSYPDHVASTTDGSMQVSLNNTGRTGLLKSVRNPLGGGFRMSYDRSGNTMADPNSRWVMASVELFDGVKEKADGPADAADQRTEFSYDDSVFDYLERDFLGYAKVVEKQVNPTATGTVLRAWNRSYARGTVFDSGLLKTQTMFDETGKPLRTTNWTYEFGTVDVSAFPGGGDTFDPATVNPVARLARSAAPRLTRTEELWHGPGGISDVQKSTETTMQYDALGNIVRIDDNGEPADPTDDQRVRMTYTDCRADSWVNQAESFVLSQPGTGEVLRERTGDIPCDTGVPVQLVEQIGGGEEAVTDLDFDSWGSYNYIAYPENDDGDRYEVFYLYDADRHSDVGKVWDSHDPPPANAADWATATAPGTATYDGKTGRMASSTDANGQTTTYTYDKQGRLDTLVGPYEMAAGEVTVDYAYDLTGPYPSATAAHHDVLHASDPIRTARFVDGLGRVRQTQQDGRVRSAGSTTATDRLVVGGAVDFDRLGRLSTTWYPTTAGLSSFGTFVTGKAAQSTTTTYRATDEVLEIVEPGNRKTSISYGFGTGPGGLKLLTLDTKDPLQKVTRTYVDVHDTLRQTEIVGSKQPSRTIYEYDAVGQLVAVQDPAGNRTTHTYDLLGRVLATNTPDGGLVERDYDPASNLTSYTTPTLRGISEQIAYTYDVDRLVGVDNPGGDDKDVTYTYGSRTDAGNVARRVKEVDDQARTTALTYDRLGQVASETTTMKVHNLSPSTAADLTWRTAFGFDGLGRMLSTTYADGEVVSYDHDSGGLPRSAVGVKGPLTYRYVDDMQYDEFFARRYQTNGNGTETETTYKPDTRRIDAIRTVTNRPIVREIQDQRYSYDLVGNVKTIVNDLPPAKANLIGAPSSQRFEYDDYYRLEEAHGEYEGTKRRTYDLLLSYDDSGNIKKKTQTDLLFQNARSAGQAQDPTTYDIDMSYAGTSHRLLQAGTREWTLDDNGNATGWRDLLSNDNRTVTFDGQDRVTQIADRSSTTDYVYDDAGLLRIERGPQGEVSTLNRYYAVRGGAVEWKEIWLGDQRIALKRQYDDGTEETTQYYLHTDAGGSPTMVTGFDGTVFQNLEYFPTGEVWVHEHSTIHRQPYRFHGAYFDEYRNLYSVGQRWFEPREQRFLSTDPVLTEAPGELLADPSLAWAYAYGANNALRYSDPDGRNPGDNQAQAQATPPGAVTPKRPVPKPLPKPPARAAKVSTAAPTTTQAGAPTTATTTSAASATTGVAAAGAPSAGASGGAGGAGGAGGGAGAGGGPPAGGGGGQSPTASGASASASASAATQAAQGQATTAKGGVRDKIKAITTYDATPLSVSVFTGKNAAKPNKVRIFGATTNRIASWFGKGRSPGGSGTKP